MALEGIDVIKEYLVSLGFAVDGNKYAQFQSYLKSMDRTIQSNVTGIAATVTKAAGVITAVYGTVITSTIALVNSTAKADLQYQIFATRMWMAGNAAKNFKLAMDGLKEYSLEDIAWNPELRNQFFQLENLSGRMQSGLPRDMEKQMKMIRGFTMDFRELRTEAAYASQWISYHLTKYFAGPLANIQNWFTRINESIIKNMPTWTKKVADTLGNIIQLGSAGVRFIGDIVKGLHDFFERLPKWAKIAVVGIGAAFALMMSGPMGWIIAGISGVLLLLDDFYAYIDGRKSSKTLAPVWAELKKTIDNIANDPLLNKLGEMFTNLYTMLFGDGSGTKNTANSFLTTMKEVGNILSFVGKGIENLLYLITSLLNFVFKLGQALTAKSWSDFGKIIVGAGKDIGRDFMKSLTNDFSWDYPKNDKPNQPVSPYNDSLKTYQQQKNGVLHQKNNGNNAVNQNQIHAQIIINAKDANSAEVANIVINKLQQLQGIQDIRNLRDLANPAAG